MSIEPPSTYRASTLLLPQDLAVLVGVVLLSLLLFLGLLMPLARWLDWLELRLAEGVVTNKTSSKLNLADRLRRGLGARSVGPAAGPLGRLIPYLAFVSMSALGSWLALGNTLLAPDIDLFALGASLLIGYAILGLIKGGVRGRRRWSLFYGLAGVAKMMFFKSPLLCAAGVAVIAAGSSRLVDITRAQGPLPWEYLAFQSPQAVLGCLIMGICTVNHHAHSANQVPPLRGGRPRVDWFGLTLISQLTVLLFLGGSQALEETPISWLPLTAKLLTFQLKAWLVMAAFLVGGRALSSIPHRQLLRLWGRWLWPFSLVALGLSIGWNRGLRAPGFREAAPLVGYVLFAVVTVLLIRLLVRVFALSRAPSRAKSKPLAIRLKRLYCSQSKMPWCGRPPGALPNA